MQIKIVYPHRLDENGFPLIRKANVRSTTPHEFLSLTIEEQTEKFNQWQKLTFMETRLLCKKLYGNFKKKKTA